MSQHASPLLQRQAALALALAMAHGAATAADNLGDAAAATKDPFEFVAATMNSDLTAPGSPAFALLDITPDKVQRPGTRRDFLVSLAQGLGQDGKPVKGLAFDISPVSLFFPKLITGGADYIAREHTGKDLAFDKNYYKRILARTTLSFATTGAEDKTDASRSAVGVRIGLIDYADPGLYWDWAVDCMKKLKGVNPGPGRTLEAPTAPVNECNPQDKPGRALWAEPSLYVGWGRSWYSSTGKLQDNSGDASTYWTSGSVGLNGSDSDPNWRLLLQGYLGHERNGRTPDPADATMLKRKDTTEGVLRLKAASGQYVFFVDWGGKKVKLANTTNEYVHHVAAAFEFQLWKGSDTWLQVATVNERGFANGRDTSGITVGFKFGPKFLSAIGEK